MVIVSRYLAVWTVSPAAVIGWRRARNRMWSEVSKYDPRPYIGDLTLKWNEATLEDAILVMSRSPELLNRRVKQIAAGISAYTMIIENVCH